MKHAGPAALDALEALIVRIRSLDGLKEKHHGIFYRKGRAFLHFHEDPAGLFADLSDGANDRLLRVSEPAEQQSALDQIRAVLSVATQSPTRP